MDFHLGILTTQYQAKIKGVRAGFDSTQKKTGEMMGNTYKYQRHQDID